MANFTITITNRVNTFGPAPSDRWNDWNWNAFKWGEGTADLAVAIAKLIGNSITPSDAFALAADYFKTVANALAPTADMGSETLTDAAGYAYVFPDRVTDADDRAFPDWSSATSSASGWSAVAAGSTTWS